ncbi:MULTISPECIES: hypothetical protein [unclassified Pseudomonas]|uniref:hypothetical protein n=1 Tax=unclassified Pseudomonas TaxID=196821 RepID=UPI002447D58D|nr:MULTISPECIES: hypothetical protein [unclassified Pseudomonas]MDH0301838.1 hypothetical protein [Pseudomonas sp. GD04091]MDH1983874.1 hypothetical protein [Pseudomonas sp. GD03689]
MRRAATFIAITLAVSGCAQSPKKTDIPLSAITPSPICKGEEQCSRMWARAIDAIQMVTRMRVMSANDTFIQTYPTRQVGYLNGHVIKQSVGDGKYSINASIDCGIYSWCDNMLNRKVSLFNSQVQAYEPRIK